MAEDNFVTPVGLARIQHELEWLRTVERPRVVAEVSYAASLGDRSENAEYIYGKKRLREIDSRMGWLMKCLDKVKVVDPGLVEGRRVRFGATVVVATEDGEEKTYRIYGEHEVDVDAGVISHKSPIARALMGKEPGDAVRFRTPGGERELEIVDVRFEAQPPVEVPQWKIDRGDAPVSVEAQEYRR
jgi:transcription elongation factor GreB